MNNTLTKPEFPGAPATLSGPRPGNPTSWFLEAATSWPEALRAAVRRLMRRPAMSLELTDRFVNFRSIHEFEFALVSRTEFPASRVGELMAHSPADLEAAATILRDAERLFANVLARSLKDPSLTGELFRELQLKLFSQDHGWRGIMEGLMRLSPAFDAYKRVALIKYMQYLRARQTIMRSAFMEKTRDDDEAGLHATPAMHDSAPESDTNTALFDAAAEDARNPRRRHHSLLKGETVAVDPGDARRVELLLAGNRIDLYTGRECYLVDDGNNTYPLKPGKNLVGRHGACDVVLDPACKAISRTHLIVEPLSGGRVLLTDLSSHGTQVVGGTPRSA